MQPLPRPCREVRTACAPRSADSVLSSFRGISSHISDDGCRFPALIGREELTSSCPQLSAVKSVLLETTPSAAAEQHMRLALISSQSRSVPPQALSCVFMWRILWLLETEERMIEGPLFMVSSQAVFTCTLLFPRLFAREFGSESKLSLVLCETAGLSPTSLISASHTSFFHCCSSPRFTYLWQERKVTFFQASSWDFSSHFLSLCE